MLVVLVELWWLSFWTLVDVSILLILLAFPFKADVKDCISWVPFRMSKSFFLVSFFFKVESIDDALCWLLLRCDDFFKRPGNAAGLVLVAPNGIINIFPWFGAFGSTKPPPTLIPVPEEVEERLRSENK